MAIPGPGQAISMTTLNTEFGGGFALSSYYRGGAFVPNTPTNAAIPTSGTIALGNFYGSANRAVISLTASGNNYDVYTNRGPTYVAGISDITVTVPGTVGSTSTGTYALLVPSAFNPADTVTIVNNGVIQGMGGSAGNGGNGGTPPSTPGTPGGAGAGGGNAIYVNRPTTITNNGTIASGGGGGGGGGSAWAGPVINRSGGGGGGGGGAGTNGGAAGSGGSVWVNLVPATTASQPGSAGSSAGGGGGGAGSLRASPAPAYTQGGTGGAGGGRGAAGASGGAASGGPSPAPGLNLYPAGGGGATGSYIVGNAFVTWPATGTRQGNVS